VTAFVIQTRRGWFTIAEKIAGWDFPAGHGSLQGATRFPFRAAAQSVIRKNKLESAPFHAHIETIEV